MLRRLTTPLHALLALLLAPAAGFAASSDWDRNDHVETRLVAATQAVGDGATVSLGLHFRLQPGWKIYWRTPGDAGFPPDPDWTGSDNLQSATIAWPAPERFSIFGLETLGYKDEVVLPLTATLDRPGEALQLKSNIRYLACSDICIPYEAKLALAVPPGTGGPSVHAGLIDRFAARVPGSGAEQGLSIRRTALLEGSKPPVVQIEAGSRQPFGRPDVFVEYLRAPHDIVFGKPAVLLSDDGRTAVMEVRALGGDAEALNGTELALTLVDGARAMESVTPVRYGPPVDATSLRAIPDSAETPLAKPETDPLSLLSVLALALLGGLILNLMPCVLPVLSIKLLSVVSHGGGQAGDVRKGFLATASGIVASMLVIAVALIAVKLAGYSVGWGIQFQQPVFLAFMTVVVTLFALNLFGLFEIILPQRLSAVALGAGDSQSTGGHFLTGAFATLLATPCSAPFVGTAIGFALSREAGEILAVFAALGVGLALPYLAVAAWPAAATALPRPGRWMDVLRRVLGLTLVATALWLLSVIAVQIGLEGAVILGALMVLTGVVMGLRRLPGSRLGKHAGIAVAVLAIAAIALPVFRAPQPVPAQALADDRWQVFDPVALRRIVAGGGTVFVDVTADWCITCQVNKKLVLDQGEVAAWLGSGKVVAMRADWTRPDPVIADYLASFGRYGIPFNAVYGPNAPNGIALPEILTTDLVMGSAAKASEAGQQTAKR